MSHLQHAGHAGQPHAEARATRAQTQTQLLYYHQHHHLCLSLSLSSPVRCHRCWPVCHRFEESPFTYTRCARSSPNAHFDAFTVSAVCPQTHVDTQRESRLPILCDDTSSSSFVNMYVLHVTTRVRLAGRWPDVHPRSSVIRFRVCATAAASSKRCCLCGRSTRTDAAAAMRAARAHARLWSD